MKRLSYCVSILLIYIEKSYCVPEPNPGEKIKFNAEDFEKLAKYANLTKRDHTAKNVNFAWKVTMGTTITTTTDPRHTSTLNEELSKKNSEIYDKLFAQLAYTLRDKVYLDRWLNEMDKGYHIFLYELQKQDKYYFIKKHVRDFTFEGDEGYALWNCLIEFLKTISCKDSFMALVDSLKQRDEFKIKTTQSPQQRNTSLNAAYNTMFERVADSLRDLEYRQRWMSSYLKGYETFLHDLREMGSKWFIKQIPNDETFEGSRGNVFWENIITFLRFTQQNGFEKLLQKIDATPVGKKYDFKDLDLDTVPDLGKIMAGADETGTLTPFDFWKYTSTMATTTLKK